MATVSRRTVGRGVVWWVALWCGGARGGVLGEGGGSQGRLVGARLGS